MGLKMLSSTKRKYIFFPAGRWWSSVCVFLCGSPVHKDLFFFASLLLLAFWLMILITPNYFLISGPSPAQLAATHNSKGQFHNTWQRALPWPHQWPSTERNGFLYVLTPYVLGCLPMWKCLSSLLFIGPTSTTTLFIHASCLFCLAVFHKEGIFGYSRKHVLTDTILCSPNIVLLTMSIYQLLLIRFKEDTRDPGVIFSAPLIFSFNLLSFSALKEENGPGSTFKGQNADCTTFLFFWIYFICLSFLLCSYLFACMLYWFILYLVFKLHSIYVLFIHAALVARWSLWSVVQNTGCELSAGNNKNIPLGAGQSLDRRCLSAFAAAWP